ncbi:MAG: phosphoribosyltransferase [Candidatus Acidiferrales bacterium]
MRKLKVLHTPQVIARRVRAMGRQISRDFRGQILDVVGLVDSTHVFMADLIRQIRVPVRCHFIRVEARDIRDPVTGKERLEIFYSPEIDAAGRNILLVRGVLNSGVTSEFLLRRIGLHRPRAVKTAVLLDREAGRRVPLEPDYFAFRLASNDIVMGYGLSWNGLNGNLPYLAVRANAKSGVRRRPARQVARKKKKAGRR